MLMKMSDKSLESFLLSLFEKVGVDFWILFGRLPAERVVRMDLWAEGLQHGAAR